MECSHRLRLWNLDFSNKGKEFCMKRNSNGWRYAYEMREALWIHDGNPKRPHALLTSGKHSNGFFNSRLVIPDEVLLRDAASDLLDLFVKQGGDVSKVNGVVGPQTGATRLAEFIRDEIIENIRDLCFWASPEQREDEGVKSMVFDQEELGFLPGRSVLLCDDVLTTSGSVGLVATAVTEAGGDVLPFILVLVNRSGLKEANGKKIIALIDHPMPMWKPDKCLLCPQGSEALMAKDPENWKRLNANY